MINLHPLEWGIGLLPGASSVHSGLHLVQIMHDLQKLSVSGVTLGATLVDKRVHKSLCQVGSSMCPLHHGWVHTPG